MLASTECQNPVTKVSTFHFMKKKYIFHFYPRLSHFTQWQKVATGLCCRISEASKAFQMEKIEHGYENMNHFTVNLNREEKIIREIDFYRGWLFLRPIWPKLKVCESGSGRKRGFRIISTMDVDNFTRIVIQCETLFSWQCHSVLTVFV